MALGSSSIERWQWQVALPDAPSGVAEMMTERSGLDWYDASVVRLPTPTELLETLPVGRRADDLVEWTGELASGSDGDPPARDAYAAAIAQILAEDEVAMIGLPDVWDLDDAVTILADVAQQSADAGDRIVFAHLPREVATTRSIEVLEDLGRELDEVARASIAVYHPWVRMRDERMGAADVVRVLPPIGHVLGVASRIDRDLGPARTPANVDLDDLVGLDSRGVDEQLAVLVDAGVNPLACVPGRGLQIWGGRTLAREQGRYLAHRRLVHRLVRSMRRVGQSLAFDNNQPALWFALRRAVTTVLLQAYRSGALHGPTPETAFEVRCDETTTTQTDVDAGRVVCTATFAVADPIEMITLYLSFDREGRIEVIER
jgi:hypothetical protein